MMRSLVCESVMPMSLHGHFVQLNQLRLKF